ncbi:hypothetical protein [Serratia fonticola]|jgi:hypothetical protein|uniref:Uncharacterized protein n=1 Tax=Serratia fonticola TaxID=47917 RepID=A0AAJ2D8H8_SERFO|nr:hypothetical protein [Serratia fonticola]MDQ7211884.1 hypothetical protein [Serratia fonticola]MDQ9126084.1 hypothetical protein [Serratia fonticola]HBE9082070.1 hypothetical protein [Serratia fonticola]HBE9092566.1 hypothetical protein [Serratia fonticola]HBE9154916.1 hypothetical protein [Serratia fonticola]
MLAVRKPRILPSLAWLLSANLVIVLALSDKGLPACLPVIYAQSLDQPIDLFEQRLLLLILNVLAVFNEAT